MRPRVHSHPIPALVLGLGQNGLATVRALGRLGIRVFGVDADLSQLGARSRYCSAIECPDFKAAGPGLLQLLEDLGRQFAERPVLFPSGDLNLSLVSDERERLARWYRLSLSRREVVRRALDKRAFYEFAMRHALPIPRTFFLDGTHDPEAVADEIEYPCIVKPFRPTAAWRRRFDTRLFICGSREELLAIHSRLVTVHREILVQEYMTGSDCELYFGMTYLGREQQPLALWTGRKLRMYPVRFGTATFAESRHEPWIAEQTVAILRRLGVRGYGTIEFKRDQRDGQFKMTEATIGRTWFRTVWSRRAASTCRMSGTGTRSVCRRCPARTSSKASSGSTRSAT